MSTYFAFPEVCSQMMADESSRGPRAYNLLQRDQFVINNQLKSGFGERTTHNNCPLGAFI